jgi:glyoxylase-like metal-dependent hydrolase (beta-lactamase superfamily II)
VSGVEVEQLTDWLWCLRTPIVQAYAIREREGFNLVDTTTAGQEEEILAALAEITGQPARVHGVLLTHGHDDHIGAAAGLRARTGARLVASRDEAGVIARERPAPPPQLADYATRRPA